MKILMIYCKKFGYKPTIKSLDFVPEKREEEEFKNIQVAFIQVEKEDEEKEKSPLKKFVDFIKWTCRKNDTRQVLLHSFAHLSNSKASAGFTSELLNQAEKRLQGAGYEVWQTPFGYFLDMQIEAPGFSLARVFKSL